MPNVQPAAHQPPQGLSKEVHPSSSFSSFVLLHRVLLLQVQDLIFTLMNFTKFLSAHSSSFIIFAISFSTSLTYYFIANIFLCFFTCPFPVPKKENQNKEKKKKKEEEKEGSKNIRCAQRRMQRRWRQVLFSARSRSNGHKRAQEAPSEHQGALMY